MSYSQRYYFTFYSDRDTRKVDCFPDEYLCSISQLDYAGAPEEIQAQENPIQINYQNTSSNKLEPIIGSEATLNLIATSNFELEDLYTENEREFMVQIYRKEKPCTLTVNWDMSEVAAEMDLEIFVNGVSEVLQFTTASGSFEINNGDTLLIKPFAAGPSAGGIPGMNLEITGLPTQRTTTYPFSIDVSMIPTSDITIETYTTYSATTYTAIRSAVFEASCTSGEGSSEVFTKSYTSATSQAAAQALADADSGFTAEGQAYANANGVCFVSPGEFTDLIWQGFIIPDGCQESFTFPPYVISVNAVDGIGLLKNLSYVQNDGNFYLGKQTFIEVIQACLVRLEAPPLFLNTCVNIYEDSMTQGDTYDPLDQCYVSSERYLKDDEFTPMNCEEVLRSILEEWTAVMIQSSGEWYIYRPTELAVNGTLVFRRYLEGFRVYDQDTLTENLDLVLGGESEGIIAAPYFHINTDQMKMIDRPYKNASMSYLYGELQNLYEKLDNPNFFGTLGCVPTPVGPCDTITISGWTKEGVMYVGLWPTGGIIFYDETDPFDPPNITNYYENNNLIPLNYSATNKERLKVVVTYENPDPDFFAYMNFSITLDASGNIYYLQQNGSWQLAGAGISDYYQVASTVGVGGDAIILSDPAPLDGDITFRILAPTATGNNIIYTNISAFIFLDFGDQIGEMHTATQDGKFTFVPETVNVFNGDSANELFVGAIFGPDQTTLTTLWTRRGISESILALPYAESKAFLRIAVEEKQRLYAGPFVRFEGSIFGYFNPLQRWTINLIPDSYFMNLSLTYDLQQNICKAVMGRIVDDEIALVYTLVPDYGATTKVTVKGTP
jgi:hypothetical protein